MLNFSLQYFAVWYATKSHSHHTCMLLVNLFPTLFVIMYMMVIAYHVAYVCGVSNKLAQVYYRTENLIVKHLSLHSKSAIFENILLIQRQ